MKDYFNQIHTIDEQILDSYLKKWQPYHAPKNTILTWQGDTEKYMYYVLEGVQKSYYVHNGKEYIIAFTYAPSFSGIPESFMTQTPSAYFLTTITESHFLRIPFDVHQQMMTEHRAIETLFRKGTELLFADTMHRYIELMAFDIETRFRNFVTRSPHLLQMVTQKDLASYLRIDPTNFSKLLGKIKI